MTNRLLSNAATICLTIALLLSGSPLYAQDESFNDLPLNGLASYIQLRKQYYIGGLYMESLNSDAETAIGATGRKRMDIRITIDRWSTRRFSQQWTQLILINNEQEEQSRFAEQILSFVDMPQDDLITGDRITIDSDPEAGTSVYLNGEKVFNEEDNAFFDILLNTWIGQRPPSSDFKNSILTLPTDQTGTDLLVHYENLSFSDSRKKTTTAWLEPEEEEAPKQQNVADLSPSLVAPPTGDTTVTAKRQSTQAAPEVEKDIVVAKPALMAPAPAVELEAPSLAQTPATATPAASEPNAEEPSPPADEPKAEAVAEAEKTEPEAPAADTQNDEQENIKLAYRSNVLKLTYLNTQYPKRAMDFKQEGLVRLLVKLNRKGKVLDITEVEKSKHRLLNKAARVAVIKSAPFPEVPDSLDGDEIEIELPFNFQL